MYTNFKLEQNPDFQMRQGQFNALMNSLEVDQITSEHIPVKVGLVVRTKTSNLVATTEEGTKLLVSDVKIKKQGEGYFSLITNIQVLLLETFGELNFEVIKNTVLIPYGAFEDQGEMIVYFNLIIEDNLVEEFSNNPSIKFVPIEEDSLNLPDKRTIIILPTLTIVSNE